MDMLNRMGDIFFHPAQALWSIFAIAGCFFLSFILLQTNLALSVFYLALGVLTLGGLVTQATTFKDTVHGSVDWNEQTDMEKTSTSWMLGLLELSVVSAIIGIITQGTLTPLSLALGAEGLLWVPRNLFPLTLPTVSYQFTVDAFATVFAVVPGEESLKTLFTPLYRAYEHTDWANSLPFALQPAILIGVAFWSALHVVLMQQTPIFFFTAFLAGTIMMWMSARAGTYLVSWLIHAAWNLIILFIFYLIGQGGIR